jgi:hypothetical protein
MSVGIFRTCQERAGTNPGRQKSKYENEGRKRTAGDEVVCFGFHLAEAAEGDTEKGENDEDKYDRVEIHEVGDKCTVPSPQVSRTTLDRRLR